MDGLYLPEPWLLPGRNTLMIFDEDGASPAQVKIVVEAPQPAVCGVVPGSGSF